MQIRDRIRELRRVKASELRPNPRNWRVHPREQQNALRGILAEVGFVGALIARECSDGSLELIDGHLRAETTPDEMLPVLILDVDEAEAEKILATFDPLSAMAEIDGEKLGELLQELEIASKPLAQMLDELAEQAFALETTEQRPAEDQSEMLTEKHQILIECDDEHHQSVLLQRFQNEGLQCRALIA